MGRKMIYLDDAIDEIEMLLEQFEDDEHDKIWNDAIRGSINAIKHHVPSAQPERKKGEWIFKEDFRIVDGYDWKCDQCGSWQRYTSNFCPNCGADMKSLPKRVWDGNTMYFQDEDKQGWTGYGV